MEYVRLTEFTTREITAESNRWSGRNYGGYSNPSFDQGVARLMNTLDRSERDQVGADLMKMALDEVVWIPLYYGPDVIVGGKNVRNVTKVMPAQDAVAWNVHVWEMQ
jgi:peptide/nickel transport system substrate-binding protein